MNKLETVVIKAHNDLDMRMGIYACTYIDAKFLRQRCRLPCRPGEFLADHCSCHPLVRGAGICTKVRAAYAAHYFGRHFEEW